MKESVGIVITVGTSFFDNLAEKLLDTEEHRKKLLSVEKNFLRLVQELPRWLENPWNNAPDDVQKDLQKFRDEAAEDVEPQQLAELHTWEQFWKREKGNLREARIQVLLVPTRESRWIAEKVVKPYLERKLANYGPDTVNLSDQLLQGVRKDQEFRDSLDTLTTVLWNFIAQNHFSRVYLMVSGGYKGFIPLLTLLGMLFPHTHIVYAHQEADECVLYPPMPITPDFPRLDSLRTVLQRERIEEEALKTLGQFLPFLNHFFEDQRGERTPIGKVFAEFYQGRRSLYGKGELLLSWIQDEKLRSALEEKLPYWEYLWIGDQIPETVEHSRRHALRLLEYAGHLLSYFPKLQEDLGDEGIAILYAALWLHDFGHGALFLAEEDPDPLVDAQHLLKKSHRHKLTLPRRDIVALDPDLVRKYHNLYTVNMLQSYFSFLLPDFGDDLKRAVLLASLYHRKKMPFFQENAGEGEGEPLESVVEKAFSDTALRQRVLLASALLSFVDGLDVQTDRVVSREYREVRETRDRYEMEFHRRCLEAYQHWLDNDWWEQLQRDLDDLLQAWEEFPESPRLPEKLKNFERKWLGVSDPSLRDLYHEFPDLYYHLRRIHFIAVQKEHFLKHGLVDMVYLAKAGEENLEVHLVPAQDEPLPPEVQEKIVQGIQEDILAEYRKGGKILEAYFRAPRVIVDKNQ